MFSPLGCFSKITCPLGEECELLNCIFLHNEAGNETKDAEAIQKVQSTQAPNKRLRLSTTRQHLPTAATQQLTSALSPPTQSKELSDQHVSSSAPTKKPKSGRVSPPPLKRAARSSQNSSDGGVLKTLVNTTKESLNPRMMANAPAAHSSRSLYLKKLHEILSKLNNLAGAASDANLPKLSEAQLITMALDEEEKMAKENPTVYANVIKLRMVALSKMTAEQWKADRRQNEESKAGSSSKEAQNEQCNTERLFHTGLSTAEEIQILPQLFANKLNLQKYDFVITPPTDEDIHAAVEGTDASMGWEQCDRCKTRFQVFPDRREDGSLTSGGRCIYHPGRIGFPGIRGSADNKVYLCCNQALGTSVGCDAADTHVFKISDEKRLASILQFEETPPNPNAQPAVCFDCEMGFTVNGMELIRLTAVTWPEGKDLLDILVRPLGAVLDLNSRFSGVRPEDFAKSVPYGISATNLTEKKPLQLVDSPMAARNLLFELISPSTPLIGHALENDLNAVRIVHPSIVDSVILFPHGLGPPRRPALRNLVKDILLRNIQVDGTGHDSREDAIAAGDLVRVKVARKWGLMQAQGWAFKDGELVAPEPSSYAPRLRAHLQDALKRPRGQLDSG